MTETTKPGPVDPSGPTAPTGGLDEGQAMLDAGALDQDDAERPSPGAGPAGKSDAPAPQGSADPSTRSASRGEGAL